MSSRITQQWATFGRLWYILNADRQSPGTLKHLVCPILEGRHKPIFHPSTDCGDHVVVYNTRQIAMEDEDWVRRKYYHHTGYPGGFSATPAYRVHERDPTEILYKEIYRAMPKDLRRRTLMTRLHLFPDDVIPGDILENVTEQLTPAFEIPRRLDEYTAEERAAFPKLFVPKEIEV